MMLSIHGLYQILAYVYEFSAPPAYISSLFSEERFLHAACFEQ